MSSDYDPLFTYRRQQANLRMLPVREIKSTPTVRVTHPFVERLIGIIRREFLDHLMFWYARDLERMLGGFSTTIIAAECMLPSEAQYRRTSTVHQ